MNLRSAKQRTVGRGLTAIAVVSLVIASSRTAGAADPSQVRFTGLSSTPTSISMALPGQSALHGNIVAQNANFTRIEVTGDSNLASVSIGASVVPNNRYIYLDGEAAVDAFDLNEIMGIDVPMFSEDLKQFMKDDINARKLMGLYKTGEDDKFILYEPAILKALVDFAVAHQVAFEGWYFGVLLNCGGSAIDFSCNPVLISCQPGANCTDQTQSDWWEAFGFLSEHQCLLGWKTYSRQFPGTLDAFEHSVSVPFSHDNFSGELTGNVSAGGRRVDAEGNTHWDAASAVTLDATVRVGWYFCQPVVVVPKKVRLRANAGLEASLGLTADIERTDGAPAGYTFSTWPSIWPIFQTAFTVLYVPVVVVLNAVLETGVEIVLGESQGNNDIHLEAHSFQLGAGLDVDYSCNKNGCTGTLPEGYVLPPVVTPLNPVITQLSGSTITARIEPYAAVYLEGIVLVGIVPLAAQVGPKVSMTAKLWAHDGLCAGDSTETSAQTLDIDLPILELVAQVGVLNALMSFDFVALHTWAYDVFNSHFTFIDMLGGGSSAMSPIVTGPSAVHEDTAATYNLRMRSCYPFADEDLTYEIDWGDGSPPSYVESSNGAGNSTHASHEWSTPASYTITARPTGIDSHGRQFAGAANYESSRSVNVLDLVNLSALPGVVAQQSSIAAACQPALALDGSTYASTFACLPGGNNHASRTLSEVQPWWCIDLGAKKALNSVEVWNTTSASYDSQLSDFKIEVGNDSCSATSGWTLFKDVPGTAGRPSTYDWQTGRGMFAWLDRGNNTEKGFRYLRLKRDYPSPVTERTWEISEIKVWGRTSGSCDDGNPCTFDDQVDAQGTCEGTPAAAGTVCRAATGGCDFAEVCDGSGAACPDDVLSAAGTECRASAGACDPAEVCSGTSGVCPADTVAASGTICRASTGACEAAEACDGTSVSCPIDTGVTAAGTVCRAAAGFCDLAETCDGVTHECPSDVVKPSTTMCRGGGVGDDAVCNPAEFCTGSSGVCPNDGAAAPGTVCRPSIGTCDVEETCDGWVCAADYVAPYGTQCRAAAGVCDRRETCNGFTNTCPADTKYTGTLCRAAAPGGCDVAETCDGASDTCPTDLPAAAGVTCRASSGACDLAETCNGSSFSCPSDTNYAPSDTVCRASTEDTCDPAEFCSGASNVCPSDELAAARTTCSGTNASGVPNACDGAGACVSLVQPSAGASMSAGTNPCPTYGLPIKLKDGIVTNNLSCTTSANTVVRSPTAANSYLNLAFSGGVTRRVAYLQVYYPATGAGTAHVKVFRDGGHGGLWSPSCESVTPTGGSVPSGTLVACPYDGTDVRLGFNPTSSWVRASEIKVWVLP